jgi:ABC-type amino acid transport substrate-binding protein
MSSTKRVLAALSVLGCSRLVPVHADIEAVSLRASFVTTPLWLTDTNTGVNLSIDAFRPVYGYIPDMIQAILDRANTFNSSLQFSVDYRPSLDGQFGAFVSGEWTGIVGDLVSGRADISAATLSQTAARDEAVVFLTPYRPAALALLCRLDSKSPALWAFTSPFDSTLWGCIVALACVIAVAHCLTDRLSPFGYRGRHELDDGDRRKLNFSSTVAGSCATLLGGEPPGADAWSSRIVGFAAMMAGMLLIANYTASLTSFMTVTAFTPAVSSFDDIVAGQLPWTTITGSQMYLWVANNPDAAIRSSLKFATLVPSTDAAVALVQSGAVAAALGVDASWIYYTRQPPCDLIITGVMAYNQFWALALSPSMPEHQVAALRHANLLAGYDGMLQTLNDRYLAPSATCEAATVALAATAVTLSTMRGVFAFVAILLLVAFTFVFLELLIYRFRFSASPFKICRRLNIFCGYHYDKQGPPTALARGTWDTSSIRTITALTKSFSKRRSVVISNDKSSRSSFISPLQSNNVPSGAEPAIVSSTTWK